MRHILYVMSAGLVFVLAVLVGTVISAVLLSEVESRRVTDFTYKQILDENS